MGSNLDQKRSIHRWRYPYDFRLQRETCVLRLAWQPIFGDSFVLCSTVNLRCVLEERKSLALLLFSTPFYVPHFSSLSQISVVFTLILYLCVFVCLGSLFFSFPSLPRVVFSSCSEPIINVRLFSFFSFSLCICGVCVFVFLPYDLFLCVALFLFSCCAYDLFRSYSFSSFCVDPLSLYHSSFLLILPLSVFFLLISSCVFSFTQILFILSFSLLFLFSVMFLLLLFVHVFWVICPSVVFACKNL